VFYNVAEDDRSDNDENELAEEERLDAMSKQGIDKVSGPKMLVNGQPLNGNGKTTATKFQTDGMTNRKENARKA
jgi:acyl-CoA-dependent ceramide synthase